MTPREALHRIVDDLPENDLPTVKRILEALQATADPVLQTLLNAPLDDEPDDDNFDGGLSEARQQAQGAESSKASNASRPQGQAMSSSWQTFALPSGA